MYSKCQIASSSSQLKLQCKGGLTHTWPQTWATCCKFTLIITRSLTTNGNCTPFALAASEAACSGIPTLSCKIQKINDYPAQLKFSTSDFNCSQKLHPQIKIPPVSIQGILRQTSHPERVPLRHFSAKVNTFYLYTPRKPDYINLLDNLKQPCRVY